MKFKTPDIVFLLRMIIELCATKMNKTKDHEIGLELNKAMRHLQETENIIRNINKKEK